MIRIGLISDTHGVLRPQASDFLAGSDHIIHAGDICDPAILARLRSIAPVTAVRGNNDHGDWALALQETELVQLGGVSLYVIHDRAQLDIDPHRAGIHVVVSGHSHQPLVAQRDGVFFVNPGSAGPRRFSLPIAAGEVLVDKGVVVEVRTRDLLRGTA